jgi:hypothetical protein
MKMKRRRGSSLLASIANIQDLDIEKTMILTSLDILTLVFIPERLWSKCWSCQDARGHCGVSGRLLLRCDIGGAEIVISWLDCVGLRDVNSPCFFFSILDLNWIYSSDYIECDFVTKFLLCWFIALAALEIPIAIFKTSPSFYHHLEVSRASESK